MSSGQSGQQEPAEQTLSAGHIVPVPHERHTVPSDARTSASGTPHATELELAQSPQHARAVGSVVPGGLTQLVAAPHIEPTPVHARQLSDGIAWPHGMLVAGVHVSQQTPVAPPVHEPVVHIPLP